MTQSKHSPETPLGVEMVRVGGPAVSYAQRVADLETAYASQSSRIAELEAALRDAAEALWRVGGPVSGEAYKASQRADAVLARALLANKEG